MQILIYSQNPWPIPDSVFSQFGDSVIRLTGSIADLSAAALKSQPSIVFVHGYECGETLAEAVKQLRAFLPSALIIPYCVNLEPNFLLRLMREGIREVLTTDSESAVKDLLKRAHHYFSSLDQGEGQKARKIGLLAAKGGDGSSCLAANLSYAIAQDTQSKVLVMDLSLPFGDLDMFLTNVASPHNLSHFSEEIDRLDFSLLESMTQHIEENLHFIPAPSLFDDALKVNASHIQKLVALAAKHYRYIVLDMGNQINPLSIAILEGLDDLIIVATNNVPSIRRSSQLLRLWEGIGRHSDNVSLVINRYDSGLDLDISQINKAIGKAVSETLPEDHEGVEEALLKGKPLMQFNPKSPLARAITKWSSRWSGKIIKEDKSLWQRLKNK